MEINITRFFNEATHSDYSASRAEKGEDAGSTTWRAAKDAVSTYLLLDTQAKVDALRDHARGFGAWDDEDIDKWTAQECNALLLQFISGDIRAVPDMETGSWDWDQYQESERAGNLYRSDTDGEIYYYLGH